MNILKNKQVLMVPVIALTIVFVFSLTLIPSVQPQPKNLPIAIVNEDQGIQTPDQPMNMGETIVEMIAMTRSQTDEEPAVKWVKVDSLEDVRKGLDEQKYYAALVIPSDYSAKQVSLRSPTPKSPELQLLINQGMNPMASTIASQILNGVVDNLNNQIRSQLLEGFSSEGQMISVEQAASLVTPIAKTVTNVNEIGPNSANGNAPVTLFQPLWMAMMASAAILFLLVTKMSIQTRKEILFAKIGQMVIGAIVAIIVGFGFTWIASSIAGIDIPNYLDTSLFLTITSFSYFLMILAALSILGIKGMAIFALMLFFGGPLLAMPPEMMSSFYQNWIYSWLPMKFMVEGLRELFFFGKELSWNTPLSVLVLIALGSTLVLFASVLKRNSSSQETKDQTVKEDFDLSNGKKTSL